MTNEEDVKFKRLEQISESFRTVLAQRYSVLSTTASIAATLLVIATFNEKLFPLTNVVRFLISILLGCIILAIGGFIIQTRKDLSKLENMRKSIVQGAQVKQKPERLWEKILNHFPEGISIILTLTVISIIYLIWS